MSQQNLPRTWQSIFEQQSSWPIIVKNVEKIHDITWSMNINQHDHFEMVYIKRGDATFQVSNIDVDMKPNDMIIIKPNQLHKFIVRSSGGCEFLVLRFKFATDENSSFSEVSLNDFITFVNNDSIPFVRLRLSRKNEISGVLNRILREHSKQQIWGDYLSYLLFMELFVLVSRTLKQDWDESTKDRSVKLKELLNIAKEYIDSNYEKELSLSSISSYVFLSESYFSHKFKSEFNISPKKYILNVRINAAKELLSKTDQKISDIAKEVGFSSQQRFNDIFNQAENTTPLNYRKQEKIKKLNLE